MRERKFIRPLSCLCVVMLACGTAFAQQGKLQSGPYRGPMGPIMAPEAPEAPAAIFYSNLTVDPCTGFKYDANNGFLLLGPNNCGIPGTTQWLAEPFVAKGSGAVTSVKLSVTNWGICTPTSFKFTVQIYDDACAGVPNAPLGPAVNATAPAAPPALASANFGTSGPLLTNGVRYWVVLTTSAAASQNGTTAVWWQALTGNEPFNLNDGNGWVAFPAASPGGFAIN